MVAEVFPSSLFRPAVKNLIQLLLRAEGDLANNAFVVFKSLNDFFKVCLLNTLLLFVKFPEKWLNLILFPLNQSDFRVLAKPIFVLLLHGWHWHLFPVGLLGEEGSSTGGFIFALLLFPAMDSVDLTVEVLLTLGEAFLAVIDGRRWWLPLPLLVGFSHDFGCLLSFLNRDHVAVQNFDLGHRIDQSESIVGLLSERVTEEV